MLSIVEKVAHLWKEHRRKLAIFFVITIVALLSFGLGYTMAKDSAHTPIIIEDHSTE